MRKEPRSVIEEAEELHQALVAFWDALAESLHIEAFVTWLVRRIDQFKKRREMMRRKGRR